MSAWSPPASDVGWQPPESDLPPPSPEEEAQSTLDASERAGGEVVSAIGSGIASSMVPVYLGKSITNALGITHGDPLEAKKRFEQEHTFVPRTEQAKGAIETVRNLPSLIRNENPLVDPKETIGAEAAKASDPYGNRAATVADVTSRAGEVLNELPVVGGALKAARRVFAPAEAAEAAAAAPAAAPPKPVAGPVTAADVRSGPERLAPPAPAAAAKPTTPAPEPTPTSVQPKPTPGRPVVDARGAVQYSSLGELAQKGGRITAAETPEPVPVPGKPHIRPKAAAPVAAAAEQPKAAASAAPEFVPPQQEGRQHGSVGDAEQGSRTGTLHDLNENSGGRLPEVRTSALTGGYDETKQDFQHAQSPDAGGQRMAGVVAGENEAMAAASKKAVDNTGGTAKGTGAPALQERGTIIDRALTGVRDWFDTNVSALYKGADKAAGGVPITKFDALHGVLSDPSKFTGAEGMQLHGDVVKMAQHFGLMGEDGFWKPATIENAERFRQWIGEQYSPRTGRAVRMLKDGIDSDVAAHGGGDFYPKARALRAKQDAMLEGPKGISKLIPEKNPDGTSSINRPVPIAGIADHIANLPKEQFDHIINVLHDSGKLGSGELAENSAAALREIKAHMAERLHEAGTKTRDGMWDPYGYHEQLNKYSLKLPSAFHPSEIKQFQTLNRAGNVLRMDKRYPGASAQAQIHGGMGLRERLGNAAESELGALLPPGFNTLGELTGASQKIRDLAKGSAGKRHLAEVEGRITKLGERPSPGGAPAPKGPAVTPLGQKLGGGKQGGFLGARNNASGESKASLEAISRGSRNLDLVRPDGSHEPVMRGVDQVDQHAPNGHLLVDRDTKEIVSRGPDLNAQNANGLKNRYLAQREPSTPLGQRIYGGKQRGAIGRDINVPAKQDDWLGEGPGAAAKTEAPAGRSMINIGLHQGDPANGGRVIPASEAQQALRDAGVPVHRWNVQQSGTEPTLVASLHRPATDAELHGVATKLGQKAISQRHPDNTGSMHGPEVNSIEANAQGWDQFNPDYFRMHGGETASEHVAAPAKTGPAHQTVTNPVRNAYPGIYDDPHEIISRLKIAPEDPILKSLFGVTRKDLSDTALGREGNLPGTLPGAAKKPTGSKAAGSIMTKENEDRLVNLLNAAKEYPGLHDGMTGWYVMDPLYNKFKEILGDSKAAAIAYSKLNHFMGMSSPGSNVATEINRGTAASMLHTQGKFDTFLKQGGRPMGAPGRPPELANVSGHPYHATAQAGPMQRYISSGNLDMKSPKVPMYIQASGVPETGFQTRTPVGDSHWSRGVGLSDTRTGESNVHGSVRNSEMQQLEPWYRDKVAARAGLPAVSAQALQWGALGGETGVETAVGAPKLELFAQAVKKAADRAKVTPEEMLKRIIKGTGHAG